MNTAINCLYVFAIVATILQDVESQQKYHFPSKCTCQYKNRNLKAEKCTDIDPTDYPDNHQLGLEHESITQL